MPRPVRLVSVLIALLYAAAVASPAFAAGIATPSPVTLPTDTPTATPLPTPTRTPTPTATLTPTPTRTPPPAAEVSKPPTAAPATPVPTIAATRDVHRKRHHRKRRRSIAAPTPGPSATPRAAALPRHPHRRKQRANKKRAKATATPAPSATPTSPVTLQVSNSIAPVVCNGPIKPDAARPFLTPPYQGWTSIVSYFDHDLPDFSKDGLVITTTGQEARPDAAHHATDFPAYWNQSLRQYLYYDGHNGYDYDVSYVPIYAAAGGKVIFAGTEYPYDLHLGYGNMVLIDHHNGYVTLYGHFSKIMVHAGEKVRRGQQIGISGNTGHSTGPHLHFTVFHNCTPTDPYGWAGPGSDPLAGYQGETSTYLWKRAPLVSNPQPGMPGLNSLPGYPGYKLLLLRLPTTSAGTETFTHLLRAELARVRRALGPGVAVRPDALDGGLVVLSPISPDRLYALPDVVSIGSPDAVLDARHDVLAALARAALSVRRKTITVGRSPSWRGFFMTWDGRTLLVGRGQRGQAIDLPISAGGRHTVTTLQADPVTGAYAVDLGKLSPRQLLRLRRELEVTRSRVHHFARPAAGEGVPRAVRRASSDSMRKASMPVGLIVSVLLLVAAGVAATIWRMTGWKPVR